MKKGIKLRIYPNKAQQKLINQTFGCCRLVYNKGLAMREEAYKQGEKVSYNQTSAMLTAWKKALTPYPYNSPCVTSTGRTLTFSRSVPNILNSRASTITISPIER